MPLADAYRAVTVQGAWHGPAIAELLAGITPAMAATAPVPRMHTIAELLQHLLLWNDRVCNALDGRPMPKWNPKKEWARTPMPWPQLLARWNRSRDLFEARLRHFPEASLSKPTPGRTVPYETVLHGIIQHTVWHGGQIAMVRSLLTRTL